MSANRASVPASGLRPDECSVASPDEVVTKACVPGRRRAPKAPRYAVLDGLRFVAALSVLSFHFTARANDSWGATTQAAWPTLHRATAFGAFGVDLFFVISGFVILMTAWGRSLPQYVASRASRLFPAYWAGVLLTGALLLLIWPDLKPVTLPQIGVNLTMLQVPFNVAHVDGVYWTLWSELRFYLLLAALMAVGLTARRVVAFAAIWPVVAALAYQQHWGFLAQLLDYDYAPLFAGGMMLCVLVRDRRSLIPWLVLAENVLIGSSWSAGFTRTIITSNTPMRPGDAILACVVVGCFALVALAALSPLRDISWSWLTAFGALTYPLYLIHEYWGWWFITKLHGHLPRAATLAAATLLCIAMAWLIQRFIEKPLAPRMRRSIERSIADLDLSPH